MPMRNDAPRIHPNRQHLTGRSRMRIALCAVAGAAVVLGPVALGDSPGDLDPTFGVGGVVTTPILRGGAQALVLQPDGKLVAAGKGGDHFALVRYNPDGSLDTSFGSGGVVTTAIGPYGDAARAVALQPDGKLVAAGKAGTLIALTRYNPDGSLDTGFGVGGKVTTSIAAPGSEAYALALQPDGKLVAAGRTWEENQGKIMSMFALVRYNPNGSRDTSFGSEGLVWWPLYDSSARAFALALQPDGKLGAAGPPNFTLVRYNPDGSLDTSFGVGGRVTTAIESASEAHALALQPDGKLVAAGKGGNHFALVRYNPNGSLDTSFGSGGVVTTAIGAYGDGAFALALQPNGKLVAAGYASPTKFPDYFAVVRYNPDGSVDRTFGADGIVGLEGNDTIRGGGGNDSICGGAWGDVLRGGPGNDYLDGGDGNDTVGFERSPAGVTASLATGKASGEGSDTLVADENLSGSSFADALTGDTGANILEGRSGSDTFVGGGGSDTVSFRQLPAAVDANLGTGTASGQGSDTLSGFANLIGSGGNDILRGDGGDNTLMGWGGDDLLAGGSGRDSADFSRLHSAVDASLATGTATGQGADTLSGVENLEGSALADTLSGDDGNNVLEGRAGNDALEGGPGSDTASFRRLPAAVDANLSTGTAAGQGSDTLSGIENLLGSGRSDHLSGNAGDNFLSGGQGNDQLLGSGGADTLRGGPGNDALNGGDGVDAADYADALLPVTVDLGSGSAGGLGSDSLVGIEDAYGGWGEDTLTGDGGPNTLWGQAGDDFLYGLAGTDVLDGGPGTDTLDGGLETDTCTTGENISNCP